MACVASPDWAIRKPGNKRAIRVTRQTKASLLMILCTGVLASCGDVPGLDAAVSKEVEAAPYPELLPAHALPAAPEQRLTESSEEELAARGARLNRRARELQ